jgi:hypothetical protein
MRETSINRRVFAAALAALLALGGLALAGPRDAASAVKPGTLTVSLKTPVSPRSCRCSGTAPSRTATRST